MVERFEPAAVTIARLTAERDEARAKVTELRAKYERLKRALDAVPCPGNHHEPPPMFGHSLTCQCGAGWMRIPGQHQLRGLR